MQSSINETLPVTDDMETPIDRLNVYDYQLTPHSELQVTTEAGERFTLRKLGVDLDDGTPNLVVSAATDRSFVGRFGIPFRGIGVGRSYGLYGEFGMTSAPVTRLQASGVLPDTVSTTAIDLIREYSSRLPIGQELLDDLSSQRTAISRGDCPYVIMPGPSNDQQIDSASLQEKVSAMVRGMVELVENKQTLPFDAREIEQIQRTFGKLIRSQCYHPSSGMVLCFQNDIDIPDHEGKTVVPHQLYALLRLDGSVQSFSVKRVSS